MPPYEVYIHLDLLEAAPQHGPRRDNLMAFIYSLRTSPYTPGDFTDTDSSFRRRQIKIIGDFAITYWVDDPVKAVMIVDLRLAD
ncbi:MAG: hypothetical protein ACR2HH_07330 [Chthoniobacterales bacterium]